MRKLIFVLTLAVVVHAGEAIAQLRTETYASGLVSPVAFVQDPTNPSVQFVVQQNGRIRALVSGVVQAADFLNLTAVVLTGQERGLLGLAFAPDYAASGRFYVFFTGMPNGQIVVARFKRSTNPLIADPGTRFDLRWGGVGGNLPYIEHLETNHNGGHIVFGPDGFLYIGLGDGGPGLDPVNRAQNPMQLLGKILRIDVNVADGDSAGYRVPADNPFVGGMPIAARPEIWAFGVRNPWRFSFDDPSFGGTGALIIGDVGQDSWEEIDYEPANRGGRNYGWRYREGAHNQVTSMAPAYMPLTDPIFEYNHTVGQSITGGFVYRGSALGASYRGRYFFADYVAGRVWSVALTLNMSGEATASDLIEHTADFGGQGQLGFISTFGLDADGELYVVSYSRGVVLKVASNLGPFRSEIRTPVGGATLSSPTVTFSWTVGSGVTLYDLQVGTTPGARDLYDAVDGTSHSVTVMGLPADGRTIYVRLLSFIGGAWQSVDYVYTTCLPGDAADFNLDGKVDLLWQHPGGQVVTWLMNGTTFTGDARTIYVSTAEWQVIAKGDFNGDGKADIVWQHPTGQVVVWIMNGVMYTGDARTAYSGTAEWKVVAAADFNGDGKTDLVWQHPTGQVVVWLMNGAMFTGDARTLTTMSEWKVVAAADFNGDHKPDLVWQHPNGAVVVWFMNGMMFSGDARTVNSAMTAWKLIGTADLNADGKPDLVWQHPSGPVRAWLLNGIMTTSVRDVYTGGTEWKLVGPR